MTETDEVLARSQELLERVKAQFAKGPSFLGEYMKSSATPTTVPFAPSAVSLDETHLVQSAGSGVPEAPESPTQNLLANEDTQRRLREFFGSRMSALNLQRQEATRTSLTEMPQAEPKKEEEEPHKEEEEEKTEDEIADQKPILDLPFVITGGATTASVPEVPLLSPANVQYPVEIEDMPLLAAQNLSEDGLWVPDLPLVKDENARRLEYRLLWQDPQREIFFGADLMMRVDTPPLSQIPPPFPIEPMQHDGSGVKFSKATEWGIEDISISRDLRIELSFVDFLTHPLSVPEDLLVKRIRQLHAAYIKDQEFSKVRYYTERLHALRRAKEENSDPDKEKMFLEKIVECHEMRDAEEHNSRMIREALIQAWRDLKDVRGSAVTISSLAVRWQSKKFTPEQKEKQEKEFEEYLVRRAGEMSRLNELQNGEALDIAETVRDLRERAEDLGLRMPGEPLWKPLLVDSAEITPLEECPLGEQQRREAVSQARVYIKVFIDKREVYKTLLIPLDNTFKAHVDSGVSVKITRIPQKVHVEMYESGYFRGERMLSTVTLPINVGPPPEYEAFEFTSDVRNDDGQLVMGTLGAKCYITADPKADILIRCPDQQVQKTRRRLAADPSSFMSVAKLLEWAENHDPNDPYMASMLSNVIAQRTAERISGKFRLDPYEEASTFASLVPTTIGMQLQQHMEQLRRQDEEAHKKLKKGKDVDYIESLRAQDIVQGAKLTKQLSITDVVSEAPIPTVPAFFGWFREIMSMYRPLKPIRTPRITTTNIEAYSRIIFRMVRALNVPERTKLGTGPGTAATLIYSSTQSATTNLYARVKFKDDVKKTRCVSGVNAEWNDPFEFPISKSSNDVPSLEELAKLSIRVDVFDEISFTVIEDDREKQKRHELIESRILGTLEIPVSSIWATGKLSGTYSLVVPPYQLGYTAQNEPLRVAIYATLDPPIVLPDRNMELKSAENEAVILRAQAWQQKMAQLTETSPRRSVLMAALRNGKPIVACRMIKKQSPPPGITTANHMLRFVCHIPNISDASVWDTTEDVWCTSQEFLDNNFGDEEEHAVLLCNMMKSKGMDAYVALGYDWLNGTTAFVIVKEAGRVTLYDPLEGRIWSHRDRFCSLYSVGVVFNDENVWANIQKDVEPYVIDWNLHDTKKWYPFFNMSFPKPPLESPQEAELHYKEKKETEARMIEREIEYEIKTAVERWREYQRTSWNPECGDMLKASLKECEDMAIEDPQKNLYEIVSRFSGQFPNYRMTGGPFCKTYKSTKDIIEEVKLREVWKTESPGADFALGVLVIPYPNELFVVWVMLASMQYIQEARPPL